MNTATYLARAEAARRAAANAADEMVEAIRAERIEVHQYSATDASHFTLGYLSSFIVGVIAELPVKQREAVINEMRRVAADKQQLIQEAA